MPPKPPNPPNPPNPPKQPKRPSLDYGNPEPPYMFQTSLVLQQYDEMLEANRQRITASEGSSGGSDELQHAEPSIGGDAEDPTRPTSGSAQERQTSAKRGFLESEKAVRQEEEVQGSASSSGAHAGAESALKRNDDRDDENNPVSAYNLRKQRTKTVKFEGGNRQGKEGERKK